MTPANVKDFQKEMSGIINETYDHYKITGENLNTYNDYFLLHLNMISHKEIDYSKSVIYSGHAFRNNIKYHPVADRKEYTELITKSPLASFERIALPKKYQSQEILVCQGFASPLYTERLIDILKLAGIKGIESRNSVEVDFY